MKTFARELAPLAFWAAWWSRHGFFGIAAAREVTRPAARHVAKKVKKARVVSRRARHTRPAAAAPKTPPPAKMLSAEQRLELLKVRASAPRPKKPKSATLETRAADAVLEQAQKTAALVTSRGELPPIGRSANPAAPPPEFSRRRSPSTSGSRRRGSAPSSRRWRSSEAASHHSTGRARARAARRRVLQRLPAPRAALQASHRRALSQLPPVRSGL